MNSFDKWQWNHDNAEPPEDWDCISDNVDDDDYEPDGWDG